ncbi:hypothetical protein [Xenorhabdus sp. IM139775]|nr:hypothetical protein [Xenorhabdus sp. IM139775]MDC9593967.1 hypothetical protein [Xenorhabdus sp. IM139775]
MPIGYLCFGAVLESGLAGQTPLIMAAVVLGGLVSYWFARKERK